MLLCYLAIVIIRGCIWGFATKIIVENKGYDDNWFWWGFFFGIIALIVACARPENRVYTGSPTDPANPYYHKIKKASDKARNEEILAAGGWLCACGKAHPAYVSSCTCGNSRFEAQKEQQKEEEKQPQDLPVPAEDIDEMGKISLLKEYKELMDGGVITPEEFEAKKKQLLGI